MKKSILLLCVVMAAIFCHAEEIYVVPGDVKVEKADRNLAVGMTINLADLHVKSNQSITLTPVISSSEDERCVLPSVTVAGRNRYYTLKREGDKETNKSQFYRYDKNMEPLRYSALTTFVPWMRNATLTLEMTVDGCCSANLGSTEVSVKTIELNKSAFAPQYAFAVPKGDAVKIREVEGEAFVDFKVNQTVILPDFGHNPVELAKIRQTIDEVKNNKDTKIISISITGYASPEGSYKNNDRLAKGRTEALAAYVNSLYHFPPGLIKTSWVPEDWAGVVRFLKDNPSFDNRDEILEIVNSDLDPDVKDARIKQKYPVAYKYMLENVYPPLRHSNYKVEFEVRTYTTPQEIAEVLKTNPGNLSLQELFVLGESLPEGSDEYADVYETAVRLFPDSEVAALNAALVAMKRRDYIGASRHLEKAGNSPEAIYARGLLAVYESDYKKGRDLLEQAKKLGIEQADSALENLTIIENE